MHIGKTGSFSPSTDLDECEAKEAGCTHPALCANTYGGYRCVCNGTDLDDTQSCVLGEDLNTHTHMLLNSQDCHNIYCS